MKSLKEKETEGFGEDLHVEHSSHKEVKNKEKKSKRVRVDEDATMNTNSMRQEEGNKEEAAKVKKKKNNEKKSRNDVASKEEKVKKKENKANEMMFDGDERIVEKQKKKKERGYISVGHEDEKKLDSQKKGKRDRLAPFDDERMKVEKKKKKKKKKKEERSVVAGGEGRKVETEKRNEGEMKADNKENEISKKKEKKRKKETNDDMIAGHEEKKVKDKKKNKKKEKGGDSKVDEMTTDIHSGNEAEIPEADQGAKKKRKLEKDDSEGKADCKVPKTKKKSSLANSKNATPESKSKKVTFSDEVKVFPPPNTPAIAGKTKDDLVRGKRFTKEEDELIKKAVMDYIETNQLGEDGLKMVLNCQPHKNLRGCWKVIGAALPWRPHISVNYRAHILFEQGERKWTSEEIELVRESYKKHGSNWKMIADELGKSRIHVKDAYRRYKLGDLKRGRWSQEEYQTLFNMVNMDLKMKVLEVKKSKYGMLRDNIGWEVISQKLGTRINSTCCGKWYKQLTSPMVANNEWADVDDYMLVMALAELDASCEEEVEWGCLLEHRSGELCRKRWQQMVRHLGEHGNKTFSEQVDVLSKRYCPDLAEVREAMDAREIVD